jgi:Uma2 family endonuclease
VNRQLCRAVILLHEVPEKIMQQSKQRVVSPKEYLAMERKAEAKSEYYMGEIFAMAGASRDHNLISTNIVRFLGNQLLDGPCSLYSSDMKVKIDKINKYTYPDIVIACEEEKFEDKEEDVLLNPMVIIEILSDTTEAYDRGKKFSHYQYIGSFVEYILVSQDSYKIERFLRQEDNKWIYEEFHNIDDSLTIESIDCRLPMNETYRKLEFEKNEASLDKTTL